MKSMRMIAIPSLALALGATIIVTQGAWSERQQPPAKFDGAWVSTVPGTPLLWTYTFTADADGRSASFTAPLFVSIDPTLGGVFPAEYLTSFTGQAVMTGHNKAAFAGVIYGMKTGLSGPEVVYILWDTGTIVWTSPERHEAQHSIAVYLPSQDINGDGLPDDGQSPIATVPMTAIGTRIPVPVPHQR